MVAAPRSGCCASAGDENRITIAVAAMMIDRMMGFFMNSAPTGKIEGYTKYAVPAPGHRRPSTHEHIIHLMEARSAL